MQESRRQPQPGQAHRRRGRQPAVAARRQAAAELSQQARRWGLAVVMQLHAAHAAQLPTQLMAGTLECATMLCFATVQALAEDSAVSAEVEFALTSRMITLHVPAALLQQLPQSVELAEGVLLFVMPQLPHAKLVPVYCRRNGNSMIAQVDTLSAPAHGVPFDKLDSWHITWLPRCRFAARLFFASK